MRKPPNYWKNIENVKRELKPLIDKLGRFPSNNEMIKEIGSSLPKYIMKYHGGILHLSQEMGLKNYDESIGRRTQGTWKKEDVVDKFLKILKKHKLNHFPSRYDLKDMGEDVYVGITQIFKTYKNFKKHIRDLGYDFSDKPKKEVYWNVERINEELTKITNEIGYFPSNSDLNKRGLSTLRRIVGETPSLKKPFLEKYSLKPRKYTSSRESGYWLDEENIKKETLNVFRRFGRIPPSKELQELGYGSLHQHILKLDNEFLEKVDYFNDSILLITKDGDRVRSNYELLFDNFLSYNNIKHETEGVISEDSDKGYLYDFKLHLNETIVYVEVWGYTRDRTDFEKEYGEKRLKKEKEYQKLGLKLIGIDGEKVFSKSFNEIYSELESLIQKFNPSFTSKPLDLNYFLGGSRYSINSIIEELKQIIKNNDGYFPTTYQLRELDGGEGLISMIQKHGGVDTFKKLLNTDIKPRELKWDIVLLKKEIYKLNKLKYVPSIKDLEKNNRLDVYGGINKNGGVKKVSKKLKIPTKSEYLKINPREYQGRWSEEVIEKEIKSIIKKTGRFPQEKDLKELGRNDLYVGIKKRISGGLLGLKHQLGFSEKSIHINQDEKYGRLYVKEVIRSNKKSIVISICDCGKSYETRLDNFKNRYRKHQDSMNCLRCYK
tara:strand:- start:779 stop:2758 length:1980 start_codon:yes stop_codon:yes gene_type:complete